MLTRTAELLLNEMSSGRGLLTQWQGSGIRSANGMVKADKDKFISLTTMFVVTDGVDEKTLQQQTIAEAKVRAVGCFAVNFWREFQVKYVVSVR